MTEPEEIEETLQKINPMVKDAIKEKSTAQVIAMALHYMKQRPDSQPSEVFFEALCDTCGYREERFVL